MRHACIAFEGRPLHRPAADRREMARLARPELDDDGKAHSVFRQPKRASVIELRSARLARRDPGPTP